MVLINSMSAINTSIVRVRRRCTTTLSEKFPFATGKSVSPQPIQSSFPRVPVRSSHGFYRFASAGFGNSARPSLHGTPPRPRGAPETFLGDARVRFAVRRRHDPVENERSASSRPRPVPHTVAVAGAKVYGSRARYITCAAYISRVRFCTGRHPKTAGSAVLRRANGGRARSGKIRFRRRLIDRAPRVQQGRR